jgi:hypothetical protein
MSYISAGMFRAIGFISRSDGLKFIKENSIRKLKNEDPEKYLQRIKRVRIDNKKKNGEIKMTMMNLQKFLSQDFTTYRIHREINEVKQSEKLTVYFDDMGDLYDDIKVEESIKTKTYELYNRDCVNLSFQIEKIEKIEKWTNIKNLEINDLYLYDFIEDGLCQYISEDEYVSEDENDNESEYENDYNEWIIKYKYFQKDGYFEPIIKSIIKEDGILIYKYNKLKMRMVDFEDKKIYECNYEDYVDDEDDYESVIVTKMYELDIDDDIKEELNEYKLIKNESRIEHKKNKYFITEIMKKILINEKIKTKMYEIYNKDYVKISNIYGKNENQNFKNPLEYADEIRQFKNRIRRTEEKIIELEKKKQTKKIKEEIENNKRYIDSLKFQLRMVFNI